MPEYNQTKESTLIQRLSKARTALTETIQKILDLNKSLRKAQKHTENRNIKQELRLLNKVADQQAKIVQLYESRIHNAGGM